MIRSQFLGVGCAFVLTLLACGDDSVTGGSAEGGNAGGGAPPAGGAAAGGSGGEGAASSDGGAGGGGSGGSPPSLNCELGFSGAIDASCGVFVQPGGLGGDGSQASPHGSLAEAVEAHGPSAFYVCGTGIVESTSLSAGDAVYGSVTCDWSWGAPDLVWTAQLGEIPVIIQGNSSSTVTKLGGIAVSAPQPNAVGGSSVAVAASNANVDLDQVSIIAADGFDGVNGVNGSSPIGFGGDGAGGYEAGVSSDFPPGGTSPCGRTGGAGGKIQLSAWLAGISNGGQGIAGSSGGTAVTTAGGSAGAACVGANGASVPNGAAGQNGSSLGSVSLIGYLGNDGANGTGGANGNGGGGGGARRRLGNHWTGGAGGGGGCGGAAGTAGTAGGSSIAIISLETTWSFGNITIEVGAGGNGGTRGVGAAGSAGGVAFGPLAIGIFPCIGGIGSAGASGGNGGSGAGGHAILIAYKGTAPDLSTASTVTPTQAGIGGTGAVNGVAALSQLFP